MFALYFTNIFDTDNAYVQVNNIQYKLYKSRCIKILINKSIDLINGSIEYYNYIIDGKETYNKSGLFAVCTNGKIMNYVVLDLFIPSLVQLYDVNILYSYIMNVRSLKSYDLINYYTVAVQNGHLFALIGLAHCYGYYYKNYKKMKQYYLMATEKNIVNAMFELADYYFTKGKFNKMESFYLKAINLGNSDAMYSLGYYYGNNNNFAKMKYYQFMAIKHKNTDAMSYISNYYYNIEHNVEKMKYYLLMANNDDAMCQLAEYYESIENYDDMIKCYLIAIKVKNTYSMYRLGKYYENICDYYNMKKYYLMAIKYKNELGFAALNKYYQNIEHIYPLE